MTRKHIFLTIIVMVLFSGCGSTLNSDPSIVWSDDFEDGDTEGWTEVSWISEGQYFLVEEGIPTFGSDGGLVWHDSQVSIGT